MTSEETAIIWTNTERDLDDEAEWKQIQQNTFTRWVNEQLRVIDEHVDDLPNGLSDGVVLIHLVQVRHTHTHTHKYICRCYLAKVLDVIIVNQYFGNRDSKMFH
jgi:hypothetical protein